MMAIILSVIIPFSPLMVNKMEKMNEDSEQTALAYYEKDMMKEYGLKDPYQRIQMKDVFDYSTYRRMGFNGRRRLQ